MLVSGRVHPKTNMSTKKGLFQKEMHLPTIDFQGTFVSFWEGNRSFYLAGFVPPSSEPCSGLNQIEVVYLSVCVCVFV